MNLNWCSAALLLALANFCSGTLKTLQAHRDYKDPFDMEETILDKVNNATLSGKEVPIETILEAHREFEAHLGFIMGAVVKEAMSHLLQSSQEANVSDDCSASVLRTVLGLKNMEAWAYRLFDSMGRPSSGSLSGTVVDFGAYDECLDISVPDRYDEEVEEFRGKYCFSELEMQLPPLPSQEDFLRNPKLFKNETMTQYVAELLKSFPILSMRAALCVPSECSKDDVTKVVAHATKNLGLIPTRLHCEVKEKIQLLTTAQKVIISMFAIMVTLVFIGTAVDRYRIMKYEAQEKSCPEESGFVKILLAFSTRVNSDKLMPVANKKNPKNALQCLHGMTALSTAWIVVNHTYSLYEMTAFRPVRFVFDSVQSFSSQGISNYTVSAETFFLITGFLLGREILSVKFEKRRQWLSYYVLHVVYRFLRFTPATMAAVGLFFLFPVFTDGPLFREKFDVEFEKCQRHWFAVLTHWNNFLQFEDACLQYTWYFNADLQIYTLVVAIVMVLSRKPLIGATIGIVLYFASLLAVGVQTYIGVYTPTLLLDTRIVPEIYRAFGNIVVRPYTHVGSMITGVFVYCLVREFNKTSIKKKYQVIGWVFTLATHTALMYGTYGWLGGELPGRTTSAIYAACLRAVWALNVGWVIFACTSGNGGIVNRFLSWEPFVPFSKLSACTYLVHVLTMSYRSWSIRERIYGHHFVFLTEFMANLVVSFFLGYLLHLTVEAPITNLSKMMLHRFLPTQQEALEAKEETKEKPHQTIESISGKQTNAADEGDIWFKRRISTDATTSFH